MPFEFCRKKDQLEQEIIKQKLQKERNRSKILRKQIDNIKAKKIIEETSKKQNDDELSSHEYKSPEQSQQFQQYQPLQAYQPYQPYQPFPSFTQSYLPAYPPPKSHHSMQYTPEQDLSPLLSKLTLQKENLKLEKERLKIKKMQQELENSQSKSHVTSADIFRHPTS